MNGRDFFKKYEKQIKVVVLLVSKLPKKYRLHVFNRIRNKDGKIAMLRRYILLSTLAEKVGANVVVFPGVYFENIENLEIGNNVSIHQMCYLDAEGGIIIGDNVSVAHRTTILSSNHSYTDLDIPIKYQDMILDQTVLGNDIWVGCGCTILAGAHIGNGSVIGANSTVTHDIEEKTVSVGSPAKTIKQRG